MLPMKAGLPGKALRLVPYLSPEEVRRLCQGCRGRHRERDALLILVLFQTGLRVSEALSLTVGHLNRHPGTLEILGKGGKQRLVACPAPLSHRLKAYAFDEGLNPAHITQLRRLNQQIGQFLGIRRPGGNKMITRQETNQN